MDESSYRSSHPVAAPKPGAPRFRGEDFDPRDMELAVPGEGGFRRVRAGDITKDDALAISRLYLMRANAYQKSGKRWARIAEKIPNGKTLGDIWDGLPERDRKGLLS